MDTRPLQRRRAQLQVPSMEPWPFSHGYAIDFITSLLFRSNLQWSHGPSAMDTSLMRALAMRWNDLQWSHGPSAMDTSLAVRIPRPHPHPSMEPWPFSHGYRAKCRRSAISDHPSMEPWPFSHGYSAWSTPARVNLGSFNGAMALQPWIRSSRRRRWRCSGPFNGAMALQPWIR